MNLRAPADAHVLPRPHRLRHETVEHGGRKLNWHQICEREAAIVRQLSGVSAKRTSRIAAWRSMAASLKKSIGEAGCADSAGDMASGMVCLYFPPKSHQWKVGVILTVWRGTAKKGAAKPTALPVPIEVVRFFRVAEMQSIPQAKEGTYRGNVESLSVVCGLQCLKMLLKIEEAKQGLDGVKVVLTVLTKDAAAAVEAAVRLKKVPSMAKEIWAEMKRADAAEKNQKKDKKQSSTSVPSKKRKKEGEVEGAEVLDLSEVPVFLGHQTFS